MAMLATTRSMTTDCRIRNFSEGSRARQAAIVSMACLVMVAFLSSSILGFASVKAEKPQKLRHCFYSSCAEGDWLDTSNSPEHELEASRVEVVKPQAEVEQLISAGSTSSLLMPASESVSIMATMDAVRAASGLQYPWE